MKTFFLPTADGLMLSIALFEHESPKALLQIIHGSVEHKGRYYEFAQYMNDNGFAVIVSDNRGHGLSVDKQYPLGYMDSFQKIIDDQYLITQYIKSVYPECPLMLLGHSLGSVFARIYLEKHDAEIVRLVVSGTVNYHTATPVGITLANALIKVKGKKGYSILLRTLGMNGDGAKWISASERNREAYNKDPLCGYAYPNESILTLFKAVNELREISHYDCRNPDLPIMSISGSEDPVTGGKKGLKESFRLLKEIGYHNFINKVYAGLRHEVLNEDERALVYKDVLEFFTSDHLVFQNI